MVKKNCKPRRQVSEAALQETIAAVARPCQRDGSAAGSWRDQLQGILAYKARSASLTCPNMGGPAGPAFEANDAAAGDGGAVMAHSSAITLTMSANRTSRLRQLKSAFDPKADSGRWPGPLVPRCNLFRLFSCCANVPLCGDCCQL
jgi:hypothetical protein